MQLRPFAPLAVIGAGLLVMTLASHPASADDAGAPGNVDVAAAGTGLLVTWQAPGGVSGLADYDLVVTDPATGKPVLERSVAADATQAALEADALGGLNDLSVTVSSEYAGGERYAGTPVRVTLSPGPAKPEAAPTVRLEGGRLKVLLPEAPAGVTGRVVQLYRDGSDWTTVSLSAGKAVLSRQITAGRTYSAAYQDVTEAAASPFSEQSADLTAKSAVGPAAVKTIKLKAVPGGVRVRWSAASVQGADLRQYRVKVVKDGTRVGDAFTSAAVQTVTVPGVAGDGVYAVTVTAKDSAGRTSSTTTALAIGG